MLGFPMFLHPIDFFWFIYISPKLYPVMKMVQSFTPGESRNAFILPLLLDNCSSDCKKKKKCLMKAIFLLGF